MSELITIPIFIQRKVRSGLKCLLALLVRFAQIYVYLQTVILVAWKLPIQGIYIKRYWKMFHKYDAAKHIHLMQSLGNTSMTEHQFCQLLGRMRLYQSLPQGYQKDIPKMLLTDTQVNNVAKAYINDENFGSLGNDLSMWKFLQLAHRCK